MTSKFVYGRRIVAALLTTSALFGAVAAAESINHAPSACVGIDGAATVRTDGQIENRNATALTVVCPADRPTSQKKFAATVWAVDRNSSEELCCQVLTKNPGGSTTTGEQVCTSGNSSSSQTIQVPEINDPYTWSHMFVRCTLPAANGAAYSRLATYRTIQE